MLREPKNTKEYLLKLHDGWQILQTEKRETLSYAYDERLRLVPGTTLRAFNTLFGVKKENFAELVTRLELEMTRLTERMDTLENQVNLQIAELKTNLLREKGLITDLSQIGMVYRKGVLKIRTSYLQTEPAFSSLILTEAHKKLEITIVNKLKDKKLVILKGNKGIGKSILARYIICKKFLSGSRVISLERVSEERFIHLLPEFGNELFYYDPSTADLYLSDSPISGTDYSDSLDKIKNKILEMVKLEMSGLVVVSNDIWDIIKNNLQYSSRLVVLDIGVKLRNKNFMTAIIKNNNPSRIPRVSQLTDIAKIITKYNEGYSLISMYVGKWLDKNNCKTQDVSEILIKAQNDPIRFFQSYLWYVILEANEEDARKIVLPLSLRLYLGKLPKYLIMDLPTSFSDLHFTPLSSKLTDWIYHGQEDLMTQSIYKLLSDIKIDNSDLRDMSNAINYIQDKLRGCSDLTNIFHQSLEHTQKWLGTKASNLGVKDLEKLVDTYVCSITLMKTTSNDYRNSYFRYFLDQDIYEGSKLILLGREHHESLLDYITFSDIDYCTKIKEYLATSGGKLRTDDPLVRVFTFIIIASHINEKIECLAECFNIVNTYVKDLPYTRELIHIYIANRLLKLLLISEINANLRLSVLNYLQLSIMYKFYFDIDFFIILSVLGFDWLTEMIYVELKLQSAIDSMDNPSSYIVFDRTIQKYFQKLKNENRTIQLICTVHLSDVIITGYIRFRNYLKAQSWITSFEQASSEIFVDDVPDGRLSEYYTLLRFPPDPSVSKRILNRKNKKGLLTKKATLSFYLNLFPEAIGFYEEALLLDSTEDIISSQTTAFRLDLEFKIEFIRFLQHSDYRTQFLWKRVEDNALLFERDQFYQMVCRYILMTNDLQLLNKYEKALNRDLRRSALVYGVMAILNKDKKSILYSKFIECLKKFAYSISTYLRPALAYSEKFISEDQARDACDELTSLNESKICVSIIESIKNRKSFSKFTFLTAESEIFQLAKHKEVFISGLNLIKSPDGFPLLLIYAFNNGDRVMAEEIISFLKKRSLDPVFEEIFEKLTSNEIQPYNSNFKINLTQLITGLI